MKHEYDSEFFLIFSIDIVSLVQKLVHAMASMMWNIFFFFLFTLHASQGYGLHMKLAPIPCNEEYNLRSECIGSYDFSTASRQSFLSFAISSVFLNMLTTSDANANSQIAEAIVTRKVFMDVAIGDDAVGRLVIGLYGKDSPEAVENFKNIVSGEFKGISYDGSTATRVEKGKYIDMGKLPVGRDKYEVRKIDKTGRIRRQILSVAEDLEVNDTNNLRHDKPGVVSMPKGGKTFLFTIATAPSSNLDQTNVVFGQVLSGLDVLRTIEDVPVTKEDILGTKKLFSEAGKGFDPRARIVTISKPILKISIEKMGFLP